MSVRFCLSYDLLSVILFLNLFISMKICIVVTDENMALLVPTESVNIMCGHNINYDMTLSTK